MDKTRIVHKQPETFQPNFPLADMGMAVNPGTQLLF
jgi:hypothetical protein